jgi:hypothetical protein
MDKSSSLVLHSVAMIRVCGSQGDEKSSLLRSSER